MAGPYHIVQPLVPAPSRSQELESKEREKSRMGTGVLFLSLPTVGLLGQLGVLPPLVDRFV